MKKDTAYLLSVIDEDDFLEAQSMLQDSCPTARRRFERLTKALAELLKDVQKEFPDAQYYTASGGFNLLIGDSHGSGDGNLESGNQNMVALSASGYLHVGDGDF